MSRHIRINFSNGETYDIPAEVVAIRRADYYAEIDGHEVGSKEWKDEFNYTLDSDYELKDWLQGNMDWADVKGHALYVPKSKTKDDYSFSNVDIEIINREGQNTRGN